MTKNSFSTWAGFWIGLIPVFFAFPYFHVPLFGLIVGVFVYTAVFWSLDFYLGHSKVSEEKHD